MEPQQGRRRPFPQGCAPAEHHRTHQGQQQDAGQDPAVQSGLEVFVVDGLEDVGAGLHDGLEIEVASPAHPEGMPGQQFQPVQIVEQPPVEAGGLQGDGLQPVEHHAAAERHRQACRQDHTGGPQQHRADLLFHRQPVYGPAEARRRQQQKDAPGAGEEDSQQQHRHGGPVQPLPLGFAGQQRQTHQQKQGVGVGVLEEPVDAAVGVLAAGKQGAQKQADGDGPHHGPLPGHAVQHQRPLLLGKGSGVEEKEQRGQPPQHAGEGHAGAYRRREGEPGAQHQPQQQPGDGSLGQRQPAGPADMQGQQRRQNGGGGKYQEVIVPAEEQQQGRQQEKQRRVDPGPGRFGRPGAFFALGCHQPSPPNTRSSSSWVSAKRRVSLTLSSSTM